MPLLQTKSYELLQPRNFWQRINIDPFLLTALLLLTSLGLCILYSASAQNNAMMLRQITRISVSFIALFIFAQIPPHRYHQWVPHAFVFCLCLLLMVLFIGHVGKGAQRWLDLGLVRFQPSEMMKLMIPMILAWYFSQHALPITIKPLSIATLLLIIPGLLIAKQPDLGTAIMVIFTGCTVIFFAGIRFRIILGLFSFILVTTPLLWHHLHSYQKQRVLTFLNPERDPLGHGYHIIQSKIAIGSGGLWGKGWLNGSQSHLHFLPEHATDFIFAVCGEEFGFVGCTILITAFLLIVLRGMYIALYAHDTFSRLLAAGLSSSFFFAAFVNIGMVSGILPVVGVPLPLVSYGGTSMVMLFASFGILMSIHNHQPLFTKLN